MRVTGEQTRGAKLLARRRPDPLNRPAAGQAPSKRAISLQDVNGRQQYCRAAHANAEQEQKAAVQRSSRESEGPLVARRRWPGNAGRVRAAVAMRAWKRNDILGKCVQAMMLEIHDPACKRKQLNWPRM